MNNILKSVVTLGVCGFLVIAGCEKKRMEDNRSEEIATESNEAKFDGDSKEAADFVLEAAKANLSEVKLGQLGREKAKDAELKSYADMMVEHHKTMFNETSDFAVKKGISIPDSVSVADINGYNSLKNEKTGRDFDKKFARTMVDEHEKAVSMFESQLNDAKDSTVKEFARKALPQLRTHLEQAKTLQTKLDKTEDNKKK